MPEDESNMRRLALLIARRPGLDALLQDAVDGVVLFRHGHIVGANHSAEVLLGYKEEELLGVVASTFMESPEDVERLNRVVLSITDSSPTRTTIRCKRGLSIPVDLRFGMVPVDEEVVLVASLREVDPEGAQGGQG